MSYLLLLLMLIPSGVAADIFSKSATQGDLDQVLTKDYKNQYYRGSYDYNPNDSFKINYELSKEHINVGSSRFNFHESLKNLINRSEFNDVELEGIMTTLSNSRFMFWQYSSPSAADLYKHLYTNSYLRLANRYQQYEEFERTVDDPINKIRKQALMDCLKSAKASTDDMDEGFQRCFDRLDRADSNKLAFDSLNSSGNGQSNVSGREDITVNVIKKVMDSQENAGDILSILPHIFINKDSVYTNSPTVQSRELISTYREGFLSSLTELIDGYKNNRQLDPSKLASLSVFGVPLTEAQIKNILLMDQNSSDMAKAKIASSLAYLKAVDQYLHASQVLERVMAHPAIEPAYKILLKNTVDYVQKETLALKEEKERLGQYAETMRSILEEADQERLRKIDWLKRESISTEQKGLLNLSP